MPLCVPCSSRHVVREENSISLPLSLNMPGDEVVQTEEQFSELFLLPTNYSLNHNAKKNV